MNFIKLTKIEDYTHRDGSVTKQIPHGNIWFRPEAVAMIEQVNGITSVVLTIDAPTSRGAYGIVHRVSETPEQIFQMLGTL